MHAAGVGHAHGPGGLVEAFAGGVVPGAAYHPEMGVVQHLHNQAVAPRHQQTEEGRLQIGVGNVIGGDVGPQVVDGDKGLV